MKGLELAKRYFFECGLPLFERECRELLPYLAFGLAGEGSDCFGFDDEISRDHDWGPGFYIWVNQETYNTYGTRLQEVYNKLPHSFLGFSPRVTSNWGKERTGVCTISNFYRKYTGLIRQPVKLKEWIFIPEQALATATNGSVFHDYWREFSTIRKEMQKGYPKDIQLLKIAARCMRAGQAGQYNYQRSLTRKELYAIGHSEIIFLDAVISIVFLLNNSYAPFYKWGHRAVAQLPVLGKETASLIGAIMHTQECCKKILLFEETAAMLIKYFRQYSLSSSTSDFLPDHGMEIQRHIEDAEISKINILAPQL